MLALLNTILRAPLSPADDHVLWQDLNGRTGIALGQLHSEVCALRDTVARHDERRWLIHSSNPRVFLPGFLALLSLGKEVVISANNKPDWLNTIRTGFDAMLTDTAVAIGTNAEYPAVPTADLRISSGDTVSGCQMSLDGSEQVVFFTSGSTGQPKAIRKPLRALTNEMDTLVEVFGARLQGAVFATSVSHLHIYGMLFVLLLPLAVAGSVLMQPIEFPEQLLRIRDQFDNTVFISSPAFLSRLDPALPPIDMTSVFSSGGPLPFTAAQDTARQLGQYPIEVYGSTETGGIGYRQQQQQQTPWTVFPGLALMAGADGIALQSPHMPGLDPYPLDDELDLLGNGRFMLKGRKDRIVKISEKRISLTEMEKFLEGLESIHHSVVIPFTAKRESLACAVVLSASGHAQLARSGKRQLVEQWKSAMRARFDNVVIPRKWQVVDEIPLNSQSKIDTARLLAGFMRDHNRDYNRDLGNGHA